ncbi:bifunctional diaminohydroxyphosphoribosylaminopyrimidine deaminase/5-amino-6-(5-phosphoribosylamino)uracil reductase RibD [Candidatus Sumerlaeota bacterium]|nr:bifunctional diaminohydroxyphosphoribosylaminopyrimidine deaminase/5-amino-6-(5-phosphoribosylamino)uracil reductase RibD [Candidatus Sumerlaeota bacterium]
MPTDQFFMKRALKLAEQARGQTSPNPMVGAVLVKKGRILAEDYHHRAGEKHAERIVLEKAGSNARGATLFVTLEPCCHFGKTPPCTDIIIQSGVSRVVFAVQDPFPQVSGKGDRILKKAGIAVESGLLEAEARQLNEAFFTYYQKKRPFIMLKWAMSLDGRVSTDSGNSKWITGVEARRMAHRLRSWHDALCVGINTILTDDPQLTVRLSGYKEKQPSCVILDESLRTPVDAAIFRSDHKIYIFSGPIKGSPLSRRAQKLASRGALLFQTGLHRGWIDIHSLLEALHRENIQSLFVEGGRSVSGSFWEAGMADKLGIFIAPKIIGGRKVASPVLCNGILQMKDAPDLGPCKIKRFGADIYLEAYRNPGSSSTPGGCET